jgi:hypothetical protein
VYGTRAATDARQSRCEIGSLVGNIFGAGLAVINVGGVERTTIQAILGSHELTVGTKLDRLLLGLETIVNHKRRLDGQ